MKKITLFILAMQLLFGAVIDRAIVEGNITTYKKLLQKLNESNNSQHSLLEKSLLNELIYFKPKQHFFTKKYKIAQDKKAFEAFIIDVIKNMHKLSIYEQKVKSFAKKIETIEEEITLLDKNSSKLLGFELQDAFYHRQLRFYNDLVDKQKKQLLLLQKIIDKSIKKITSNQEKLLKEIEKIKVKIAQKEEVLEKIKINIEQTELINNKIALQVLQKKLKKEQLRFQNLTYKFFALQFELFLSKVLHKDITAFKEEKTLSQLAFKYNILTQSQIKNYLLPYLLKLEKRYLGQIKTLAGSSKQEFDELVGSIWNFLNRPFFHINKSPISIFKIIFSLFVFALGFFLGSFYKRKVTKLATSKTAFTQATKTLLANLGYYIIVIIAFFIALHVLGVELSSLALVAGALSVGIGFGLQNVVANFVSGLILMFERSIKVGDYIEIEEYQGYVTDIRMRSTTIKTNDNIDIVIPNQNFIKNNVINWTMNDRIRRFAIPFGVAYGTDAKKVIKIIKEALMHSEYRKFIIDNALYETKVIMTEMGESSVNFELLVWVKGADKIDRPKRTKSLFLVLIYETLRKHNIEIPFPQRDIHIKTINGVLQIKEELEQSK